MPHFFYTWPACIQADTFPIWDGNCNVHEEVVAWLDENLGAGRWGCIVKFSVLGFENENDMLFFKLRWNQ
jgi:hypothetical protein